MPKLETIGAILREVRQEKGYKLEAVAKEIGCSKGTLSKIETGQKQPTITQLNSLAMVLGVNLSYILRDTLEPEDYELSLVKSFINRFVRMVDVFKKVFPSLDKINQDLLWLHVLTSTVMYAKYVVEGTLPDNQETEDTVFQLLTTGLSGYLKPEKPKKSRRK